MEAAPGERSSEGIRMADRAASQQTLDEFVEMLLGSPRKVPAPEAAPAKAVTFDDLVRALGLEVKASTPAKRPSPSQAFDEMLREVFGLRAEPAATPQPEPQPTVLVAAMPSLESSVQDADWTPSTAGTMPAYTVYEPATSPQFEPRQVAVPTPPSAQPAGWSPWKVAVAALGVLGVAGLGYLGARRFQQLEQTVHVLLAEFQGDVDGKLRTLHGRVAAIERTAAVDRTQAIREVRRALQAESDELRGHREWLASIRANAPANATREAEEQLTRADREIDDLFARIDKTEKI